MPNQWQFKTEIKDSTIHGLGRFTMESIPEGKTVLTLAGDIVPKKEAPKEKFTAEKPIVKAQKPVFCGDAGELLKILTEKHKEVPILIFNEISMNGEQTQVVVFVNTEKGTASVIENMQSGFACLIANGRDALIVPLKEGQGT